MRRLVATIIAGVALGACGGDTQYVTVTSDNVRTVAGQTASTQTTSTQTTTSSTPVRHFDFFRSPSGNIGCHMDRDTARCDIRERSWQPPPKPANCDVDYGYGIEVSADEGIADLICAGDTALDADADVLGYGERNVAGSLSCTSEPAGVTCLSEKTGSGFFLSRQRYQLF